MSPWVFSLLNDCSFHDPFWLLLLFVQRFLHDVLCAFGETLVRMQDPAELPNALRSQHWCWVLTGRFFFCLFGVLVWCVYVLPSCVIFS